MLMDKLLFLQVYVLLEWNSTKQISQQCVLALPSCHDADLIKKTNKCTDVALIDYYFVKASYTGEF